MSTVACHSCSRPEGETTDAGEGEGVHTPVDVYEMPDESAEALLRRIEDGTAVLAFRVCSECAPQEVLDRIDDGELDLSDGDALDAQWPCKFTHHPKCYQRTGVPDDLPAGLCDCKVLRMLDCSATPDADDASEIEAIAHTLRAAWGIDNAELAGLVEWIFAYTSTRVSAAATRAADDRAERIAQAIEGVATYTVHEAPAHGGYSRQGVSPESVRRTAATIARTTP